MRGASQAWERDYSARLEAEGVVCGLASAAIFADAERELYLVVHGDDFAFLGYEQDLVNIKNKMQSWYQIKVRGIIGSDPGDDRQITILNRELTWDTEKLVYRADPKHRQIVLQELGLEEGRSKALNSPMTKDSMEAMDCDDELLAPAEATQFRALIARFFFLDKIAPTSSSPSKN